MEDTCGNTASEAFQGWIQHASGLGQVKHCDVDEVLWPDQDRREDVAFFILL